MDGWAELAVWLFPQAAVRVRRGSIHPHLPEQPRAQSPSGPAGSWQGPGEGDMAQQGAAWEHCVCTVMGVGMKVLELN